MTVTIRDMRADLAGNVEWNYAEETVTTRDVVLASLERLSQAMYAGKTVRAGHTRLISNVGWDEHNGPLLSVSWGEFEPYPNLKRITVRASFMMHHHFFDLDRLFDWQVKYLKESVASVNVFLDARNDVLYTPHVRLAALMLRGGTPPGGAIKVVITDDRELKRVSLKFVLLPYNQPDAVGEIKCF